MIYQIEKNILEKWNSDNKDEDPYDYILDEVCEVTTDIMTCGEILRSLWMNDKMSPDYIDAIRHGFDDLSGFAFFYLVRYLTKDSDLLSKMSENKTKSKISHVSDYKIS